MLSMNNKGQSFDVFKLLISAVIAVVILSVLMGMISQIFFNADKPIKIASRMLKDMTGSMYNTVREPSVKFSPNDSINAASLAEDSGGIQKDQVCVSVGTLTDPPWQQSSAGENPLFGATFIGSTTINVKLVGMCGTKTNLQTDLGEGTFDTSDFKGEWFQDCGCFALEDEVKCCVFALSR